MTRVTLWLIGALALVALLVLRCCRFDASAGSIPGFSSVCDPNEDAVELHVGLGHDRVGGYVDACTDADAGTSVFVSAFAAARP